MQMAWLPLLPDASNVSPILFPFHIDREKKKERERGEQKRPDAFQVAGTSGFYVDDAELAIMPEKKIVLSPCRGFSPGRAVSAGCSPATNQPRIQ